MTTVRRTQTQCFLLQTLLRVTLSVAVSLPVLAPLQDSNLLMSARGDARLLSDGATVFASVLMNGSNELERQGYVIIAVLLVAWLGKVVVQTLVFNALTKNHSPTSQENILASLELFFPFALLSISLMTSILVLIGGYLVVLPQIGAVLEPSLGDRGADLAVLGLLGLLGLLSGYLVLVADLTRSHLALTDSSLRYAIHLAYRDLRHHIGSILLQAAPRAIAIYAFLAVALYWHFLWQRSPSSPLAPLPAVAVVELAAAAATWLYLDWVLVACRLCKSPNANVGA